MERRKTKTSDKYEELKDSYSNLGEKKVKRQTDDDLMVRSEYQNISLGSVVFTSMLYRLRKKYNLN